MAKYEITTINGYAIQSTELAKASSNIIKLVESIKTGYIRLGKELANLRDRKLYELMTKEDGTAYGYIEYCDEVLGVKKSALYRALNAYERVYVPLNELPNSVSAQALLKLPDVSMSDLATLGTAEAVKTFALTCDDKKVSLDGLTTREFAVLVKAYIKGNSKPDDTNDNTPEVDNNKQEIIVQAAKDQAAEIKADVISNYPADVVAATAAEDDNAADDDFNNDVYDLLVKIIECEDHKINVTDDNYKLVKTLALKIMRKYYNV